MGALGYVMQVPEEEKYLNTKAELHDMLVGYLGGRAGDLLFVLFRFRDSFFLPVYLHKFLTGYSFFLYQVGCQLIHQFPVFGQKFLRFPELPTI